MQSSRRMETKTCRGGKYSGRRQQQQTKSSPILRPLPMLQLVSLILTGFILVNANNPQELEAEGQEAWHEYKRSFNKSYTNATEEAFRMKIFIDNLHYIEGHNTRSNDSFTVGLNPLSDLTTDEINVSRNGFRWSADFDSEPRLIDGLLETLLVALNGSASVQQPAGGRLSASATRAWYDDLVIPSKLDWRAQGRVTPVKDQGSCGSCWAFASVGALESILAGRSEGGGPLLSEQNLVDCSNSYGNHGCAGGLMNAALRFVHDHGIMASKEYPYEARQALALSGPLPVAIDASQRAFHNYKTGVYDDPGCKSSPDALNHAVLLVGYGTDRTGGDYWLLKNSWSSKWGDGGYIKMARNRRNFCGIASFAVLPIS